MTEQRGAPEPTAPEPTRLGAADRHRDASDAAAARADYRTAVAERFRALVRGLEQRGVLETRRSRTADETAVDARTPLPQDAPALESSATVFDEIVYGGRAATEEDYRFLAHTDRYSHGTGLASPTAPATPPVRDAEPARRRWNWPAVPTFLRSPQLWSALGVLLVIVALIWALPRACSPTTPPPPPPPSSSDGGGRGSGGGGGSSGGGGGYDMPRGQEGHHDSLADHVPSWVGFGALQLLVAAVALAVWRGRRRGTVVDEPLPVQVPAHEITDAHARLYRRSGDRNHVASVLRTAMLHRVLPSLGLAPDAPPDTVVASLVAATGARPEQVAHAMHAPVPDDATLTAVADELDWIEGEVHPR